LEIRRSFREIAIVISLISSNADNLIVINGTGNGKTNTLSRNTLPKDKDRLLQADEDTLLSVLSSGAKDDDDNPHA
jgi:hypothetical protein